MTPNMIQYNPFNDWTVIYYLLFCDQEGSRLAEIVSFYSRLIPIPSKVKATSAFFWGARYLLSAYFVYRFRLPITSRYPSTCTLNNHHGIRSRQPRWNTRPNMRWCVGECTSNPTCNIVLHLIRMCYKRIERLLILSLSQYSEYHLRHSRLFPASQNGMRDRLEVPLKEWYFLKCRVVFHWSKETSSSYDLFPFHHQSKLVSYEVMTFFLQDVWQLN